MINMIKRILMKLPVSLLIIKHFDVVMVKRILPVIGAVLVLLLFSVTAVVAAPFDFDEEDADTVLAGDEIIRGDVSKYSGKTITLDSSGNYRFCRKTIVFGEAAGEVAFEDIESAERVELYINSNCIRKVIILRSAQ